jgi:hypothetical protein
MLLNLNICAAISGHKTVEGSFFSWYFIITETYPYIKAKASFFSPAPTLLATGVNSGPGAYIVGGVKLAAVKTVQV